MKGVPERTEDESVLENGRLEINPGYERELFDLRSVGLHPKQKLAAFLTRRGFTWDVVSPILKTLLGEKAHDEE